MPVSCVATMNPNVLIRVLGDFEVWSGGEPVHLRVGGKAEILLTRLALRPGDPVSRDELLYTLWPNSESPMANQSLNSLVYSLHKLLGDELGAAPPVLHSQGAYRLNVEAGVGVDVAYFEWHANAGNRQLCRGDRAAGIESYDRAVRLYRGDLCGGMELRAVVERERLRALYLTILARLADHYYDEADYTACLDYATRLLSNDPCREDAHRLVMRCHTRRGERAQALRQYRLCRDILCAEFDALPEPATIALYDQVRFDPSGI